MALKTLPPEDFFASRPYLVPEWVGKILDCDPNLHHKLLRILHGKYKSVMMKRKVRLLNEIEAQWLMEKLGIVFEKAYIITKREVAWLRQQNHTLQISVSDLNQSGNQVGS